MSESFELKFVGRKISRVKFYDSHFNGETFITGSYGSTTNYLDVWSVDHHENLDDANEEQVLKHLHSLAHTGDVLALDTNGSLIAVGSSIGNVNLVRVDKTNGKVSYVCDWDNLHRFKNGERCPCTDLSFEDNIATCGEDGTINILDITRPAPIRQMESCDSAALTSITWVTRQSVAVVNTCGQLKIYDVRQNGNQPAQKFVLSGELSIMNCLEKHPSQNHILATGTHNGLLAIYDVRQENVPVTILEAHNSSPVTDVKFHPNYSNKLFTSSSDGSVWQWNGSNHRESEANWWLFTDSAKHKVEVSELTSIYTQANFMHGFEVNSVDVSNNICICGTDNGAICVFYNLTLS